MFLVKREDPEIIQQGPCDSSLFANVLQLGWRDFSPDRLHNLPDAADKNTSWREVSLALRMASKTVAE